MKVSFEDIGHLSATFSCDQGAKNQLCKMTANAKVAPCADGDSFCGIIETVRKGFAGVQLHGFAEVAYSGTAPTVGFANLQADGKGGVKVAGTRAYLVVSVDTAAKTAVIEL